MAAEKALGKPGAKVMAIRFSSLGDCILLLPTLLHMKEKGAEEVAVITKRAFQEVFILGGVDRVVSAGKGTGVNRIAGIVKRNLARGYTVVDAHNTLRSRLATTLAGLNPPRLRKYYRQRLGLIIFKRHIELPHMIDRYGRLSEVLGYGSPPRRPARLQIPRPLLTRVRKRFSLKDGYLALAPGSRWKTKRWGAEKFAALGRWFRDEYGMGVIVLGDRGDAPVAIEVAHGVGPEAIDLCGRTSIAEAAACLSLCRALVGNDSGLIHLAEATGVPVVAVFGPTVEQFGYFPTLPESKVCERDIPCRPCSRNGSRPCPRPSRECMEGIGVDEVKSALVDLLERRGPKRYLLP